MAEARRFEALGACLSRETLGTACLALWIFCAMAQGNDQLASCSLAAALTWATLLALEQRANKQTADSANGKTTGAAGGKTTGPAGGKTTGAPAPTTLHPAIAIAATLAACAPAITLAGLNDSLAWGFLGGIGMALLSSTCFNEIGTYPLKRTLVCSTAAFVAASCVRLVAALVWPGATLPLACLLAISALTCGASILAGGHKQAAQPDDARPSREPLPAVQTSFLVSSGALFGFMACYLGFSHKFSEYIPSNPEATIALGFALQALVAIFAALWVASRLKERDGGRALDAVAVVLLLAAIVVLFADRESKVVLLALQQTAQGISLMLLWLSAAALAQRMKRAPTGIFCLVSLGYFLCHAIGLVVGDTSLANTFLTNFPREGIFMFTACLAILMAYSFAVLADLCREMVQQKTSTVTLETSFIDGRCEQLGRTYALTEREVEIVKLLCHGRSRAYIAENLYLSENTVKWYCRQIYQKLDIHKKQELLTLIGVE